MDNDEYGKSKKMSAEWIKKEGKKTKIIKTSIFGPEINSKASLMEWFLSQKGEIDGYSQYYWNGNSTLTWAKYCLELMKNCQVEFNGGNLVASSIYDSSGKANKLL